MDNTFVGYVNELRLNHAAMLLVTTDSPIIEIHTEKAEFMRCAVPLGTVLFLAFDVFLRVKKTCLLFGTFVQNDIRKRTAFQKNTNIIKNREKIYCKTQLGLI